ncbi:MAG TPA: phosphopantetheine-binding protein [Myxococcaceae bacterium]|jgi:maltose O-acetyltransferase
MIRQAARAALQRLWLNGADTVGRDVRLNGRPFVDNLGLLVLGDEVEVSSTPVQSHLVTGPGGALEIGRAVRIGHGAAIVSHARVEIGEGARIGPFAMIMDTDFHEAGAHNSAGEPKPIRIGRGAVLESRVTVLRGTTIGEGARVRAGSVVSGDVPAGVVVAGVPARPERAGAAAETEEVEVGAIVRSVFGLKELPPANAGPGQVPGWDSLGALKLLLALEEAFGVTLTEHDMMRAKSVADLDAVVREAGTRAQIRTMRP